MDKIGFITTPENLRGERQFVVWRLLISNSTHTHTHTHTHTLFSDVVMGMICHQYISLQTCPQAQALHPSNPLAFCHFSEIAPLIMLLSHRKPQMTSHSVFRNKYNDKVFGQQGDQTSQS